MWKAMCSVSIRRGWVIGVLAIALAIMVSNSQAATGDAALAAVRGLLERLLPGQVERFVFEPIPAADGKDVFEIESRADKTVLRGNNGVAIAMGLNWYLKHYCCCHVSWYGNQLKLPEPLPRVEPKIRQVSWARHRYFLNYCCFGYSLPWWDWPQWERLIDWMALNGVNMPLAVTGQEAAWQAVCRRLDMSEAEIIEFLAGPPYLPFQWMGCLDGWGGPLPSSWIARHVDLERKILERERQMGMTPVLQGFTGHVPAAVARLFPQAQLQRIKWADWETHLVDPLDPLFAKIAGLFLEEQTRLFGTDHFYAADTFIEMVPPRGEPEYLAALSRAIFDCMARSDPQAVWVLQGWAFRCHRAFWTQPRIKAFLDATADDRMVVFDLFCENEPMWNQTDAFCGKPWLWCNVQNFGRPVVLAGALNCNNTDLMTARSDPKSGRLIGLGFVNEGLCYNPVVYDLMFEMAWRHQPVDLKQWIAEYAEHRYGRRNADAERAWQILLDTVFKSSVRGDSAATNMPTLARMKTLKPRYVGRLVEAWHALLQASGELGQVETYRFDLVNVARQVLADHSYLLQADLARSSEAKDAPAFEKAVQRFLDLLADLDELLATHPDFLLGRWLEDAVRWGDTQAERDQCQWNARRVLTLWDHTLRANDYARKQWSGMLSGYYAKRWKSYLDAAADALRRGQPLDEAKAQRELFDWMVQWSSGHESYPSSPHGDSVAVAEHLWRKYAERLKPAPAKADAISLTTGKAATSSHELPRYPAP